MKRGIFMLEFAPPGLEEFYRTYAVGTFAVSADETRIAFATNLSGKYNVWGMDLPNTFPYALTYQDQAPAFVRFDPLGRYILVGFDHDGDECTQIYAISPTGGALQPVCIASGKRHLFGALSRDGQHLYYTSDKENPQFMNLYHYDLETGLEQMIHEGQATTTAFDSIAPDRSSFTYGHEFSNTFVLSYVVVAGEPICLTPDHSLSQVTHATQYVDANTLVFVTNYGASHSYVATFDIPSRRFAKLFDVPGADVSQVKANDQGRIYFIAEQGVEDALFEGDLATGVCTRIEFPGTVCFGMTLHQSGRLYASFTREDQPTNLYRRELDGSWTQLTNAKVVGVSGDSLVRAQTVRYPSFDGLEIEALLWRARPERRNGHTLIFPHGGPQAADRKYFWSLYQFLLSEGYDIFQANYRGSTGYGAEFTKMIERDWGGGPRQDMIAGIDYLLAEGLADRERLFVIGGSYGGYMTLLLHGRHADYFRAAVDIFGPSNLFSFVESVPEFWKPMMDAWVGNPERDREKMTEDSPITWLDGMTKPMLVIQGANDPRVVKAESDQIVAKLQAAGRHVEYLVLDDEGHGFSKKENELRVYKLIAEFLKRHQKA